jgi:hypothetical protein
MPAFATFMLIAWVPITALIFARLSPAKGVVISLLWGYLLLPERIGLNLPVLPTLDKYSVPALSTLVFYFIALKREARQKRLAARRGKTEDTPRPVQHGKSRAAAITNLVIMVLVASSFLTFLTNRTPEIFGPTFLPGMGLYDTLSLIQTTMLMLLPFLLARHALATREMMLFLLKSLVIAGLVYSLFILIEARLSPQINRWIYGYHAHSFAQHIRGGHFRAMVFLEHGLRVGIFMSLCTLAAATLFRVEADHKKRLRWLLAVLWFFPVLYLSRNTGAMALTLLFTPIVLFTTARLQMWIAAVVAAIVLFYPMARGSGIIPVQTLVTQFEKISPARAQSLEFRLDNEDILLKRANQRPLSGWGMFGRNRVFDPETGKDISITDGTWIIIIGIRGWIGYLGLFGILCLPPILLALRRRDQITILETGLAIMLMVNLIDLIPNSSMVTHIWLMSGALWGRLGWQLKNQSSEIKDTFLKKSSRRPRKHLKRHRPPRTNIRVSQ